MMNPYSAALEAIDSTTDPRMYYQIVQHVGDMNKAGESYELDWFDPIEIAGIELYALTYPHELSRETALTILREYSLVFSVCSPEPTSNLVLSPNSVSWETNGTLHERLV